MGRGIVIAVAFLLSCSSAGAASGDVVRDVTARIGAAEDGKLMHLHGMIDDCLPDSCFICPDWSLASRPEDRFRRKDCYSILSWKDANAGLLLDEMYRFSDVIVTARFHFNKPASGEVDMLCLDFRRCEQSGFEDVEVTRLIERRPVERVPNAVDPVTPVQPGDDAALRKLFWDDPDFSLVSLIEGGVEPLRTFTRPPRERGAGMDGWLCYRRSSVQVRDDEPFLWPTSYRAVELRSPANPYRCRRAIKEQGTWRIIRELQKLPVYGLD